MNFPTTSDVNAWKPVVLAVLENIAADSMVRTPDVDAAIVAAEGFPGWDHWGHIKSRGKDYPKARRDMSFALSKLRDEGKVFSPKRGSFTMKQPEVTAATAATGLEVVAQAVEKVRRAAFSNHPIMEADENLRLRVIDQTKCFGAFSPRARTCRGCPLAGFCAEARTVRLAEAAARIEARNAAVPCGHGDAPDEWIPDAEAAVAETVETDEVLHTAQFPLFCRECRAIIEPGSKFARREGEGAYHPECLSKSGVQGG